MTQEEKDLLLKDLCGRLPYGVKLNMKGLIGVSHHTTILHGKNTEIYFRYACNDYFIDEVKPYLFPLSSMTEAQKQEYTYIVNYISSDDTENWKEGEFIYVEQFNQLMHFYHINHLDYNGLIPMGLAEDATGKNIY